MTATSATDPTVLPADLQSEMRLKIAQVAALTGLSHSKIHLDVRNGRFPSPERRGARCSRWRAGDVLDHLKATAQSGKTEVGASA